MSVDVVEIPWLAPGAHDEYSGALCAMEAAARVAGEPWTDRPASVSPVITELVLSLNDAMGDVERQRLGRLISVLPGTRRPNRVEVARSWMVMDWHCRRWPATWLGLAGCHDEAAAMLSQGEIKDLTSLCDALQDLEMARQVAAERRYEIWTEAHALDEGAAYNIAVTMGTAQVAAIRALGATSAWAAAWDMARAHDPESWNCAVEAARSSGRDAALVVAWRAAWAAGASWAQATAVAGSAVRPAVDELQRSAIALIRALIDRG